MSTFQDSFVSRVLFARPISGRVPGPTAWRWRRLTTSLFDPYQPELHYMRGPGPKWRANMGAAQGAQARLEAAQAQS
jgi:hypothetical protein